MFAKNKLPFILAAIVLIVAIYFLFIRPRSSSGKLPLGIGEKDQLKPKSTFISRFGGLRTSRFGGLRTSRFGETTSTIGGGLTGDTTIMNAINLPDPNAATNTATNMTNNTANNPNQLKLNTPTTLKQAVEEYKKNPEQETMYPGQPEPDDNYFKYKLSFFNMLNGFINDSTLMQKMSTIMGTDVVNGNPVFTETPDSKIKEVVDSLTKDQKQFLTNYFVASAKAFQNQLTIYLDVCGKMDSVCTDYQKSQLLVVKNYMKALGYILNFDINKPSDPKISAGFDEYSIDDNMNITGSVNLNNSIRYSDKKIKAAILRFWGSGSTNSTVSVYVDGKEINGSILSKVFDVPLAYSYEPNEFYPTVYTIPLDYPVTISNIVINVTSDNGAFQQGFVTFVYQ